MTFQHYSLENAPEASKPHLKEIEEERGLVPEVAGVLAGAPAALEGYIALDHALRKTSFTPQERDVVLTALSTGREERYVGEQKFEALQKYALGVVENKGRPSDEVINDFLAAGYQPPQALEIVLAAAFCTLRDYTGKLAHLSGNTMQ